ncbi:MAG: hypothetical protein ACLFNQ_00890 [Spirochaetaceae bacterium]
MEADDSADKRSSRRRRPSFWTYPVSNFYPGYGDGDGRLDRIEPIAAVSMQRILPRYDLSSSRTRTSGLGPALIEGPGFAPAAVHGGTRARGGTGDKDPEPDADAIEVFDDNERGQIFDIDA